LNFAALHGVPVLFVCENNGLAVHSPAEARQSYPIGLHAASYGIPVTVCTEGWDLEQVHRVLSGAVQAVRSSRQPHFVECHTYRMKEHVGVGDDHDVGYRSRAGLERWLARDPLAQDQALVERLRPAIEREIDDAVAFAEASPWPTVDDLLADVA
jgi:TPP-dependent pyruvate/acetoin dehydrogenase alpha subunit